MPSAPLLPCASRIDVFDVLIDSEPHTDIYRAAHVEAARLCSGCVRQCDDRITTDASLRTVADFDGAAWIPKPTPILLLPDAQPPRNAAKWARTVAALAGQGLTAAAIAEALRISKRTVTELLACTATDQAA